MDGLQETFLERSSEDILVYGIHDMFFNKVKKVFISKNITYGNIARIFGLKGKKPEKNLWAWRKGKSGIPLRAIRRLAKTDVSLLKELTKSNLVFGERRSKHKFEIPTLNKDIAYLAGLISGDGNIQNYFTRIVDQYKENLQCAEVILKRQLKLPTTLRKEKDNKWLLEINSKVVSEFFEKVIGVPIGSKDNINVPQIIKKARSEIKLAYIKGWMDAEASVEQWFKTKEKWYPRICFKIKNKKIWKWMTKELETYNICVSKYIDKENSYRFQINRRDSIKSYLMFVGFLYPTKLKKLKKLKLQTETLLPQ